MTDLDGVEPITELQRVSAVLHAEVSISANDECASFARDILAYEARVRDMEAEVETLRKRITAPQDKE